MRTFPLTALLLFLFSLSSFADEDSWLPSFIGDAFKNDLEKAGTYRAHFDDRAYVDLEFDRDTVFITFVAYKEEEEERLRFIEDGFKLGYEIKDNKIYFESALTGIEAGNMARVDDNFLTIKIRRTKSLDELVFYKLLEPMKEGEYLVSTGEASPRRAIESCTQDWRESHLAMMNFKNRMILVPTFSDTDRHLAVLFSLENERFSQFKERDYFLQVNSDNYLYALMSGRQIDYSCLIPVPLGYKSFLISRGFEIVEEDEYTQILADEKAEKARLEEEQRLAEEERKRKEQARKAAERKRKAEEERLAQKKREAAEKLKAGEETIKTWKEIGVSAGFLIEKNGVTYHKNYPNLPFSGFKLTYRPSTGIGSIKTRYKDGKKHGSEDFFSSYGEFYLRQCYEMNKMTHQNTNANEEC